VKRVLTAIILIPPVILALFMAPLWLFTLLVLGVALLAAREYLDIAQANGLSPFRRLCYLFLVCVFLVTFAAAQMMSVSYHLAFSLTVAAAASWALLLLIAAPFILLVVGMRREPLSQALPDAAASFLLLPYIGASLASMVLLRSYSNGALFLFYVMLLVWTGDIAGYYVGRAIGKRKIAPRVSPAKSWAGTIASALAAVVAAVALFRYVGPIHDALTRIGLIIPLGNAWYQPMAMPHSFPVPPALVVVFALCLNIAAQLGDLVESMLKRGGGVKDSGDLLPGHGGVLDRIDALLFAAPVGCFFYLTVLGKYFRWVMVAD
jgi:phosphatidate cytidylyltransferase